MWRLWGMLRGCRMAEIPPLRSFLASVGMTGGCGKLAPVGMTGGCGKLAPVGVRGVAVTRWATGRSGGDASRVGTWRPRQAIAGLTSEAALCYSSVTSEGMWRARRPAPTILADRAPRSPHAPTWDGGA